MTYPVFVYVAGPYTASDWNTLKLNVGRLYYWSTYAMMCHHVPMCMPLTTCGIDHIKKSYCRIDWVDACIKLLKKCDQLWVVPDYEDSIGTIQEIGAAKALGIPITYVNRLSEDLRKRLEETLYQLAHKDVMYAKWALDYMNQE